MSEKKITFSFFLCPVKRKLKEEWEEQQRKEREEEEQKLQEKKERQVILTAGVNAQWAVVVCAGAGE